MSATTAKVGAKNLNFLDLKSCFLCSSVLECVRGNLSAASDTEKALDTFQREVAQAGGASEMGNKCAHPPAAQLPPLAAPEFPA